MNVTKRTSGKTANGSIWFLCSTQAMRELIIRNRTKLLPSCNYVLCWKDAHGFGIELATASWVPAGHTSINR